VINVTDAQGDKYEYNMVDLVKMLNNQFDLMSFEIVDLEDDSDLSAENSMLADENEKFATYLSSEYTLNEVNLIAKGFKRREA
jgi:hypothetical protein